MAGTILGLDIGTNSLGWALLGTNDNGPAGIICSGVRIFPAGVDGDIEKGRDESRAIKRREARMRRRMLERRARRMLKLCHALQRTGLLPAGAITDPASRVAWFQKLDAYLVKSVCGWKPDPHTFVYQLRARALDHKLEPHELGRAIYQLAQRRGFLSNRKSAGADKEEGVVKESIKKLREAVGAAGCRTGGEYLARLNPEQERIRGRWLSRQMLLDEFNQIWAAQAPHHAAAMTTEAKKQIERAIFHQRPLKSAAHLIGECELEPGKKRAPAELLICQRFRLLQKVNDLQLIEGDGKRPLTLEQKKLLIATLEQVDSITFPKLRKLLKVECRFNLEVGKEQDKEAKLIGNRTGAKLRAIFGNHWEKYSDAEREQIVEDVRSFVKEEALKRRGIKKWGLDEAQAEAFSRLSFPDEGDYISLSRQAILKILPLMEQGMAFATARKQIYGEKPLPPPAEKLPSLKSFKAVRNPAVERTLTEMRKVVNALVRAYGKPDLIRVEMARDLKKGRLERKEIHKSYQDREKERERMADKIKLLPNAGITNPRRSDIEKALLWEECNGMCPYSGKTINFEDLFTNPRFDIDHIIPFSRSLDDSFANKVLCDAEQNRNHKRNRTPWEAYGADSTHWAEIMARVSAFRGKRAFRKKSLFEMKEVKFDDFTARHLNDTRYASKLAMEYLGLLYGAGVEGIANGKKVIQAGRGQITYQIRNKLGLNNILKDGGEKSRDDHRHHAVDAVAIAITDSALIKRLGDDADRAAKEGRPPYSPIDPPWEGFWEQTKESVDRILVSHRPEHRLTGALHEETIYSREFPHPEIANKKVVHTRKKLAGMSKGQIEDIVDPAVRREVMEALKLRGGDLKKAFADEKNPPMLPGKNGGVPIRAARVVVSGKTIPIGKEAHQRQVMSGSNHHVEIWSEKDEKGNPVWQGIVVSTMEASRRRSMKEPVVQRNHGDGSKFLFHLTQGDILEREGEAGEKVLFKVNKFSGEDGKIDLACARIRDARKDDPKNFDVTGKDGWRCRNWKAMQKSKCRKVTISPIGDRNYMND